MKTITISPAEKIEVNKDRLKAMLKAIFFALATIIGGFFLLGWQGSVFALLVIFYVNAQSVHAAWQTFVSTVEFFTNVEFD